MFTIALPSSVSFVLWFMVVFARLHVSFFRPLVLFSFSFVLFCSVCLCYNVVVCCYSFCCYLFHALPLFPPLFRLHLLMIGFWLYFVVVVFFVLLFLVMIIANYFAPLDLIFRLLSIEKIEIL